MSGHTTDYDAGLKAALLALAEDWTRLPNGYGPTIGPVLREVAGPALRALVETVERCPECRHMPHGSLGFCPNMASDNDCSCTYVTPPETLLLPDRHGNPIEVPNECAECGGDGLNVQGGTCGACDGSGLASRAACQTCGGATAVVDGEAVCVSGSYLPHPPSTRPPPPGQGRSGAQD